MSFFVGDEKVTGSRGVEVVSEPRKAIALREAQKGIQFSGRLENVGGDTVETQDSSHSLLSHTVILLIDT